METEKVNKTMSYRELRNFAEVLRVLGYSRLVSVENFRKPNFPLIAEILQWLTLRYDPTLEISIDIETEQDRVIFIKTSAQLIATKAHIKLNTKKLYLADGHAVQELLKMASLLYEAAKSSEAIEENAAFSENQAITDSTLIVKKSELKKCRQIASEITQKGVNLYDSLMKEMELREQRNNVLSRQLKISQVETGLKNAITDLEKLIETVNNKIDNVASDEANLDSKIEKKQSELQRYQKRLQTLKSIRPAFMDEYEKLEEEVEQSYETYVTKFRCLVFLEYQLEDVEKLESDRLKEREEKIKKMIEQMKQEEILRSNTVDDSMQVSISERREDGEFQEDEEETEADDKVNLMTNERNRRNLIATTASKRSATGRVRIFGSMISEDKDGSLDSDLELDGDEDASDLESEDELELMNLTDPVTRDKKQNSTLNKPADNESDSDF